MQEGTDSNPSLPTQKKRCGGQEKMRFSTFYMVGYYTKLSPGEQVGGASPLRPQNPPCAKHGPPKVILPRCPDMGPRKRAKTHQKSRAAKPGKLKGLGLGKTVQLESTAAKKGEMSKEGSVCFGLTKYGPWPQARPYTRRQFSGNHGGPTP